MKNPEEYLDEVHFHKNIRNTLSKILSPDGPANYIRPYLNKLTEEEFAEFVKYHLATCERQDLIGAAAHTLDILRVK
jgi:uncharacterized protein with HEPN domain